MKLDAQKTYLIAGGSGFLGQWKDYPVKKYSECKYDILSSLVFCPLGEKEYYSSLFNLCVC